MADNNVRSQKQAEIRKNRVKKAISVTILALVSVIMIGPFLWAVSISLQGPHLMYEFPPRFFKPPFVFENYREVLEQANFLRYALNSVVIAVICIVGSVFSNTFVGFGFAKYNFKGREALFFTVIATMMLPGNIMTIAQYVMWKAFGAIDTYVPLTLPAFFGGAYTVFLMRQAFMGLPNEFYEAALMDGANPFWIYFKVYLPLIKPMIAITAMNTFTGCWNNMFGPLIFLTSKSKYTVAVGLLYMRGQFEQRGELLIAGAILACLPILVLYFFTQKYFVQGLASAGIKG